MASGRITVADQDRERLRVEIRGNFDDLWQELRQVKASAGLDPEEDLVEDWEVDETVIDYLPSSGLAEPGSMA